MLIKSGKLLFQQDLSEGTRLKDISHSLALQLRYFNCRGSSGALVDLNSFCLLFQKTLFSDGS